MTTPITKERLSDERINKLAEYDCADNEEVMSMAREIQERRKAAMGAEPVGEVSEQPDGLVMDGTVHLGGSRTHRVVKGLSKMKRLPLGTKFYTAPPAPVFSRPVHPAISNEELDNETLDELIDFRRSTLEYHSQQGNKVQTIIHGVTLSALQELQERRRADSAEPAAFTDERNLNYITIGRETSLIWGQQNKEEGDIPLYRHAQPAPVSVPDEMEPTVEAIKRVLPTSNPDEYAACIGADMWNACRAAMLQGAENPESRCTIQTAPALDSSPKIAESRCSSSPAIPDGWKLVPVEPTLEMIKSGANAASTGMLIPGMYRGMLAAAPQQEGK